MTWIQQQFDPRKHNQYIPKFPEKYIGKRPPVMRSSWETAFAKWCDHSKKIVKWGSEEIEIKYRDPIQPIDKYGKPKFRRYYPDFVVTFHDGTTWLIEIKPNKESNAPKMSKAKNRSTMIKEERTWRINKAKWQAAERFCRMKGWKFKILTEKELFGK